MCIRDRPQAHGIRAGPRHLRRCPGGGDQASLRRDVSEVLQPRAGRREARLRARLMRGLLEESFRAAVAAADPLHILASHLPAPPRGRTFVAAAGKAATSMALAVEKSYRGDLEGIAITRYGHG